MYIYIKQKEGANNNSRIQSWIHYERPQPSVRRTDVHNPALMPPPSHSLPSDAPRVSRHLPGRMQSNTEGAE